MNEKNLKIALVHDFLTQVGGAEKVLEVLAEMFPEAPIYTLLYDREKLHGKFQGKDIRTSFLQKFPRFLRKRKKWLLPLMPIAPETFNLRDFDLIISSCGAWSKGIITRLDVKHVCYLHSPMRFAWNESEQYLLEQRQPEKVNFFVRILLNYLRTWDWAAANRPDFIISNSLYTRARAKKYYGRDSRVIYPPVFLEAEEKDAAWENKSREYFLIVSRLAYGKKIEAAIEAFNKLELPLWIVGEGPQKKLFQKMAKSNVKFWGWQPDEKLPEFYAGARAFIFPAVEDFGLAAVEALLLGTPVIALKAGGALETLGEGVTGEFFSSSQPEIIAEAVKRFMEKENNYNRQLIRARGKEFSREKFKEEIRKYLNEIKIND